MKIELKNISVNERMSEETHCFVATLYVDDKAIGTVSNRGQGGCDDFQPKGTTPEEWKANQAIYAAAEAYCTTLPDIIAFGAPMSQSLEIVVGDLLEAHLIGRDFDRHAKKAAVVLRPGVTGIRLWDLPKGRTMEALFAFIRGKHPDATILNTLPRAEAVALFKEHAA